ncbi:MAG TPA: hypothetical protein PKV38_15605, partial [bacterium]|nr:hypothetical protein [bacterium]
MGKIFPTAMKHRASQIVFLVVFGLTGFSWCAVPLVLARESAPSASLTLNGLTPPNRVTVPKLSG